MSANEGDLQIISAEAMTRFCIAAMKEAGLSSEHAELLADTLVQADLRGVHSHGSMRIPIYFKGYEIGGVNPKPSVKVLKDSGATAVMDGDDGLGLVVSYPAMKLAMDKAAEYGVGAVTIRRSNHYGMAAYWPMLALERDMIGYTTTNAHARLAPWGGVTSKYGNNPSSYAIPAGKEWPIVLDMALSVAAFGKIRLAAMKNEPIPQGWAMDKDGNPATDPRAAMEGLLLPIGGYKGYGLAMIHEVLAGVLSGGLFGTDVPSLEIEYPKAPGVNHFFMVLDVAHFMPVAEFKERVDKMIRMMKSSKLAPGQDKIYLPGEIEFELHRQRLKEGIPYAREVVSRLKKLAQERHIHIDF